MQVFFSVVIGFVYTIMLAIAMFVSVVGILILDVMAQVINELLSAALSVLGAAQPADPDKVSYLIIFVVTWIVMSYMHYDGFDFAAAVAGKSESKTSKPQKKRTPEKPKNESPLLKMVTNNNEPPTGGFFCGLRSKQARNTL